jgi:spore germination protein KB
MIIFAVFLMLCAQAIRKGPVKMTRYGLFLTILAIVGILMNSLMLINETDIHNLMPVFTMPVRNYLIGAHIVTMLPLCESFIFTMFIPFMEKPKEIGRALIGGMTIGGAVLFIIVLRDVTVLGKFVTVFVHPTFNAIRMINIADILTRLEIIYAGLLIIMLFLKVSVAYYATVSCLQSFFDTASYTQYIYCIGALAVIYSMACFNSNAEHIKWLITVVPTYSSFFLLILPLMTLIVSLLRGNYGSKREIEEC